MARRVSLPVRVSADNQIESFERLSVNDKAFDEKWLQRIVHACPGVLPVHEIAPSVGRLIPLAMEVPVSQGFIDNLFVTGEGDIVFSELKLWRNPQARREVVAQCLDYVAALSSMAYEDFEAAVLSAVSDSSGSLFGFVEGTGNALDEADFVDAVTRNLATGRIVAIVAGDGIRTQAETLSSLFDDYISSAFTFGLVELTVYPETGGGYLIVPSTLAKTAILKRVIVDLQGGNPKVEVSLDLAKTANETPGRNQLTENVFYELMNQRASSLPAAIKSLLKRLEPLGVYPGWKGALNLYRDHPTEDNALNLGYIQKNGQFYSSTAGWFHRHQQAKLYHQGISDLIGGKLYQPPDDATYNWHDTYATINGKSAPRIEQLLPEHEDALFNLMREYLERVLSESENQ